MDLKITPEQFQQVAAEQQNNNRKLRTQELANDLKAFAILAVAFASIIISAEFATPVPLFIFCVIAFAYFMRKPVKNKRRRKAR